MTSKSGLFDVIGIHVPDDIIGHFFYVERGVAIGGAEVAGVEHVDVTLLTDIMGGEEIGPGLVGVKHFTYEDHV
jgi:hypothetical protein